MRGWSWLGGSAIYPASGRQTAALEEQNQVFFKKQELHTVTSLAKQVESGMCVTHDPQKVSCPQQSSLFLRHAPLEFRFKTLLCAALQGG